MLLTTGDITPYTMINQMRINPMNPIALNTLPNPNLVETLFQELQKQTDTNISSHWIKFGPMSRATIKDGKLLELGSFGFGDIHGSSRLLEPITIASYLAILPQRRSILKWLEYGRKVVSALKPLKARLLMISSGNAPRGLCWKNT